MEILEAVRTTGACRYFKPDPVPDDVLKRLFDAARYGPQGGNRQPVRYIVVRDPVVKKQLKEWYLASWRARLDAGYRAGMSAQAEGMSKVILDADHLANHFDEVPVLIVVCAVLADLVIPDLELNRPSVAGGASIYPSVQNLLLAARQEGLGATLTTILCESEAAVRALLGIPDGVITVSTVALGYPARPLPTRLRRAPVSEIVFAERYGEPLFAPTTGSTVEAAGR
ncbi:MAG: nitroreductase family protein [Acidimicrobiia bacterium]